MSMWSKEDYYGFDVSSSQNFGQINPESDFGKIIYDLSKNQENNIFVDIGTWNGLGSTRCFLKGMLSNKNSELFTIENNLDKSLYAQSRWQSFIDDNGLCVNFIHGSLINNQQIDDWLIENNIELSMEQKSWLEVDKANSNTIITLELEKNDLLLIDGSEFCGFLELSLLKNLAKYILLDDVCTIKNKMSREYLLDSLDFELVVEDLDSRNGYSVFQKKKLK